MTKKINKSSLLQLSHIQRTHLWDLEIIRRPVISNIIDETLIRSIVRSVDVPKYEVETKDINVRGMTWDEVVNVKTNGEWAFTAYELVTSPLRALAIAWQNAQKTGTLSRKDQTADLKLTSKDHTGKSNAIYIIKYWFPTSIEIPEAGSEPGLMEIKFTGKFMDLDIRRS